LAEKVEHHLAGHRSDTWRVEASLIIGDGNDAASIDLGTWDKKTGGAIDSDTLVYYPGGMESPIALGGRRTTDNVTLTRRYGSDIFDQVSPTPMGNLSTMGALNVMAGRGVVRITQTPLDNDGKAWGNQQIFNGTLKRVQFPEADNEGGAASVIEIEVSIKGFPTVGNKNG